MSTLAIIFLILFLVALAALFFTVSRKQSAALTHLRREEEAILAEERRMFGFLHDLGEAISRTDSQNTMYRLIVEGTIRVTDSRSGALYLVDNELKCLVPRFVSDDCVPLIELNDRVIAAANSNPAALLSFLRLQTVPVTSGLLGRVYSKATAELVTDLRAKGGIPGPDHELRRGVTVMAGPLISGSRQLGVIVVAAEHATRRYSQNDFEVFNSLAEQSAFALANAIAHQQAEEKKHLEAELRSASEIQRILLPERDPELSGFVVTGRNIPARVLSGDYYDYVWPAPGRFGAVIADVSGKGPPAALITAMCRSVLRSHAPGNLSPSQVLSSVNRMLYSDIREDMFVSMIYLLLDPSTGGVTLARAGHTTPLLWRSATQTVEEITAPGMAVGIDRGEVFDRVIKDHSFVMSPGDCLLLYTDGVNEAMDAKGDEFGEDRIKASLAAAAPRGATAVVDELIDELERFLEGRRSNDDITLIALQKAA